MSIQKKSLISTLKTAKKANMVADNKGGKQVSAARVVGFKGMQLRSLRNQSLRIV